MSEIHVQDFNFPRLTENEIKSTIISIATHQPIGFISTKSGIIAKFSTDEACNFIFAPNTSRYLHAKQLYATLSPQTQKDRNLYIADPPSNIFGLREYDIGNEIQIQNKTVIVEFKKFTSKKTNRNYFILTPINNEESKRLAALGKV